ncbi:hypothetical protein CKO42_09910 [Lamprobacter modestohalophilus]|uniref:Methylated-DNA-[protein]-cysteine S-methyltransferase DNA binding domain-containing protein n=1 Tax=Lamprobacter modestohalophilus TaxID=1064514 RepID=A0A9X0W8B9_9GAMM|nr:methylated-DNA--[protein]-cysteine S-methyltransferase [Lamprobacter modestohalophilus]MBK1618741.1 hypothetical protein [Lamprobacter modestohalophilus]
MNYSQLPTPFGAIGIFWQDHQLIRVLLAPELATGPTLEQARARVAAPTWLSAEMEAYFTDPRHHFSCAIEPTGTVFQRRVWAMIAALPPGCPRTYGSLAEALDSSARAVGNACRANPVPLRIPCHRVIAARGLGGFAGDRSGRLIEIKRWLLDHEAMFSPEQPRQSETLEPLEPLEPRWPSEARVQQ